MQEWVFSRESMNFQCSSTTNVLEGWSTSEIIIKVLLQYLCVYEMTEKEGKLKRHVLVSANSSNSVKVIEEKEHKIESFFISRNLLEWFIFSFITFFPFRSVRPFSSAIQSRTLLSMLYLYFCICLFRSFFLSIFTPPPLSHSVYPPFFLFLSIHP